MGKNSYRKFKIVKDWSDRGGVYQELILCTPFVLINAHRHDGIYNCEPNLNEVSRHEIIRLP